MSNNSSSSNGSGILRNLQPSIVLSVVAVFVILILVVILTVILINNPNINQSLAIGVVIVLVVSVLLLLLFLFSIGYNQMNLTDRNQALGLPPGSIRALIALLLILIWVIVSIFLFTGIGQQNTTTTTVTNTATNTTVTTTNGAAEAIKFGQQFYTTMSTLVVAIAAFYFGSSTFRSGLMSPGAASPTVSSINPKSGPAAGGTSVTLTGSGFTGATSVSFGSTATNGFMFNSDTQITATSPAGSGTVDVTITTPNGTSAIGAAAQFTYT